MIWNSRKQLKATLWLLPAASIMLLAGAIRADEHITDVVYGHKDGLALVMDVFKPTKPNGIGVLWMVSGGWISRHSDINVGLASIFTRQGETVFEIEHGSQPRYIVPEILKDIQRAVRFVRYHSADYGVDPMRLGISGMSSGGHLSLMTGATGDAGNPQSNDPVERQSSAVQAVACFFPPTDMLNWGKPGLVAIDVPNLRVFWPALGVTDATPRDKIMEMGRAWSPMSVVTAAMPPTLIIHGGADPLVPLQQSQEFDAKLEQLHVVHKLVVVPGKGHGWAGMEPDIALCAAWYLEQLKGR